MAYYRKRYRRRRPMGRKKTWRRNFKRRTYRLSRRTLQPVHYFTRFHSKGVFQGLSGSTSSFKVLTFKITDVPNWTEFQNMFDFFKIKAIKVMFIPASNVTSYQSTTDFNQSSHANRLFSVVDNNDSTTPSSVNDLRQYKSCRCSPGNRIHKRFFYPKPLIATDEDAQAGGGYGMAQSGSPWIAMDAGNSAQYFGLKVGLDHPLLTTDTEFYVIEAVYYMAFKAPK